jgi:hypothetical protein
VEIDPRRRYTPSDVAASLNCSYDTAIRRMLRMPGVINLGAKERRFRRGKPMLRILGGDLLTTTRSPDFVRILYTDLRNLPILRGRS